MTAWTPADPDALRRNADLYGSPFRNADLTYSTPKQMCAPALSAPR